MPLKSASSKELRNMCKDKGLSTVGTKVELMGRLEEDEKNQMLSPTSQDGTECDAILVARSEVGGEEEMKMDAKDALGQALEAEELCVEEVRGELVVCNRRGLSFAGLPAQVDALSGEVASHKLEIASHKLEVASHKRKIASLEDRLGSLTMSLDAYRTLRNRFISTYKRDKLASDTEADRRIIGAGNAWAHGGDAVVDAQLYEGIGGRTDHSAFKKLYGMSPWTVQKINHRPTIDVLNVHAEIVASKHKSGSAEFHARFAKFVRLFEESGDGFDVGYLTGDWTDVTRAYWSFLNCIDDEVTSGAV